MKDVSTKKMKLNFVDEEKTMKGILCIKVYKHVNGEKRLIEEIEENNLIVNKAREQMAHLIAGDTEDRSIASIGFGEDGTTPTVADTSLTDPFIKPVDGFEYPEESEVQDRVIINWSLDLNEANDMEIKEFGLFCHNGALFCRRVRPKSLNKLDDLSFEGTWTIIF
uniref:Uncharacterized protein n=1 Tax=uncultured bacterium contig00055 TaxID=1181539 RepID=A0A806K126_9BACT|nr:hypothetical protein [uncultured bacterium contig00055]